MPSEEARRVEVAFTPEFKRNVRRLARKYRRIRSDVAPVIERLERGETPGDQIQRTGFSVFKVRIRNRDAQRGKSGGYRMIYLEDAGPGDLGDDLLEDGSGRRHGGRDPSDPGRVRGAVSPPHHTRLHGRRRARRLVTRLGRPPAPRLARSFCSLKPPSIV